MSEEEKADILMRAIGSLEESSEELEEVAEECEEQEEAAIGFLMWLGHILKKVIG
ncbi:MAG: hypothetical protein KDD34_10040 [Bdellovibrionales bacterium]|nr:hypothetical protein [Bdellovibrionales bacterium]MCB0408535.1 hypothetical protein [Bdellovibrionales bacterium]